MFQRVGPGVSRISLSGLLKSLLCVTAGRYRRRANTAKTCPTMSAGEYTTSA